MFEDLKIAGKSSFEEYLNKYDRSAECAIEQIKKKHYPDALKDYHGNVLLVGINYSRDDKKHTCVIEEWKKQ